MTALLPLQDAPAVQTPTFPMGLVVVYLAVFAFMIASMWKVFTKAGQPGWASIVPFYNLWVMLKIAGKPGWWMILFLIPLVNLYPIFALPVAIAHRFGRSTAFGLGLIFLGFIFFPILAFGDSQYTPPPPSGTPTPAFA